jgi:TolA-binding protein
MRNLIKEIEDRFEEIEEANVTGNLDGGEGPVKTPHAFSKSKDEEDLDDDHIEVLGMKKSKENHMNTKKLESLERKLENKINEISYKEYKKDENLKQHQKINHSIKEINSMMFKLERIVNQNTKLKTESGVHNGQYWKSTQKRFGKISERMLKVARSLKELSS